MSRNGRRGWLADFFIRLWQEKPLGTACGILVVILILVAMLAERLAPYPYQEIHLPDIMQGASARYLLGTDHLGRDLLSRILHGARISLTVGLAATALNALVAVLIGGISGFLGGRVDLAVQRFVDAWMAFPGLLLLLTIMSIVGQGLLQIILVLGIAAREVMAPRGEASCAVAVALIPHCHGTRAFDPEFPWETAHDR